MAFLPLPPGTSTAKPVAQCLALVRAVSRPAAPLVPFAPESTPKQKMSVSHAEKFIIHFKGLRNFAPKMIPGVRARSKLSKLGWRLTMQQKLIIFVDNNNKSAKTSSP